MIGVTPGGLPFLVLSDLCLSYSWPYAYLSRATLNTPEFITGCLTRCSTASPPLGQVTTKASQHTRVVLEPAIS